MLYFNAGQLLMIAPRLSWGFLINQALYCSLRISPCSLLPANSNSFNEVDCALAEQATNLVDH